MRARIGLYRLAVILATGAGLGCSDATGRTETIAGPDATKNADCQLNAFQCGQILDAIFALQNAQVEACRDAGQAALARYHDETGGFSSNENISTSMQVFGSFTSSSSTGWQPNDGYIAVNPNGQWANADRTQIGGLIAHEEHMHHGLWYYDGDGPHSPSGAGQTAYDFQVMCQNSINVN